MSIKGILWVYSSVGRALVSKTISTGSSPVAPVVDYCNLLSFIDFVLSYFGFLMSFSSTIHFAVVLHSWHPEMGAFIMLKRSKTWESSTRAESGKRKEITS